MVGTNGKNGKKFIMKNEKKMVLELKWATAQTVLQYSLFYCKRGACLDEKKNCIVMG